MMRILSVIAVLVAPYLWNDAIHATGTRRHLWIAGGIVVALCIVSLFVWGVVLQRAQKTEIQPVRDPAIPVGLELANAVADRLDAGNDLAYGHAYYCGMGFTKYGKSYIYASVHDGEVITPKWGEEIFNSELRDGGKLFEARTQFVEWLSVQTDNSLHGNGNQNITLQRMESFVRKTVSSR
jgi:hypothetical protein